MITKDEEKLIFLRLELNECQKIVERLRSSDKTISADLKEWEDRYKELCDRVFEMTALEGIEIK